MGKTYKKKRRINPGRLILTVIIVVLIFFAAISVKNIISLHIEKNDLEKENARLEDEKNQLQNELENADDPEYIEEQARQQLRMVMPGEVLYIIEEEGEKAKSAADGKDSKGRSSGDSGSSEEKDSGQSGEGDE